MRQAKERHYNFETLKMDVLKDFESNNGEVQRLKEKRKQKIIEKKRKEKELKEAQA